MIKKDGMAQWHAAHAVWMARAALRAQMLRMGRNSAKHMLFRGNMTGAVACLEALKDSLADAARTHGSHHLVLQIIRTAHVHTHLSFCLPRVL